MSAVISLLERLVRRVASDEDFGSALLGDLAERRLAERQRRGPGTADRRHVLRLASAALHLCRARLRPGQPRRPGTGTAPEHARAAALRVDLAHAARSLLRRPATTTLAVATMALAIGVATAVYTIADAVLLRPLPYPRPERLVRVWSEEEGAGGGYPGGPLEALDALRALPGAFAQVEAWETTSRLLTHLGEPTDVPVVMTTPGLLSMLGAEPRPGRSFVDSDRDEHVVVVSHALWRQRMSGSDDAVDREILLGDVPYRVIGVAPAWFRFPDGATAAWVPMPADAAVDRPMIDARLATDRDDPLVDAALESATRSLRAADRLPDGWQLTLWTFREWRELAPERALWILLGAVAFLVLIASANLANLRLADVLERQRQIAVAAALGAGRGRLLWQLLLESLLVALAGATLGVLLAVAIVDRVLELAPPDLGFLRDQAIGVDARVLGVLLVVTGAAGILGGLAPAMRGAHASPSSMLAAGGRAATASRGQRRLRAALVLAEVAISTFLLIGSGLLLKSFTRLNAVDPGFAIDGLAVAEVSLGAARYPDPTLKLATLDDLVTALGALPGIEASAVGTGVPPRLARLRFMRFVQVEGGTSYDADRARDFASVSYVSPGYFRTLGLPVERGRALRDDDRGKVIVSANLARRLWPRGNAVGARFRFGSSKPWMTVIGVADDVRQSGYDEPADTPEVYLPLREIEAVDHSFQIVLRTTRRDRSLSGEIRESIRARAPELPIARIATLRELYSDDLGRQRFNLLIMSALAVVGALLATLGLYGVISYRVSGAVRELGIRIALGAGPTRVFRGVVARGVALAGAGVGGGMLAGFWLSRLLQSMLFNVDAHDAGVFAAIAAASIVVAALASGVPARRATRIDPVETLRRE